MLFIIYPPHWVNNSKSVLLLPLVWAKASAIALQKQHAIGLIASVNHNYHLYPRLCFFPLPQAYRVSLETVQSGLPTPSCSIDGGSELDTLVHVHVRTNKINNGQAISNFLNFFLTIIGLISLINFTTSTVNLGTHR